jgi:hypothetical protein
MSKTSVDIEADVERLIAAHYYSEEHELEWASKQYYGELDEAGKQAFEGVMMRRLTGAAGLADVSVCSRLGAASLTAPLAALLNRQADAGAISRAVLVALMRQPDEQAYEAVERFLDSELEGEALQVLTRMNFRRALPHLRWAIQKEHLHNFCLHAMHDEMKHVGMEALLESVKLLVEPDRSMLSEHMKKILGSKVGDFNPFTESELAELGAVLL